ncbi:unnamed protein product, partial [Prorocentrum cordatum]
APRTRGAPSPPLRRRAPRRSCSGRGFRYNAVDAGGPWPGQNTLSELLLQELPDDLLPVHGDCDIFVHTGWVISLPMLAKVEAALKQRGLNNSRVWLLINQEYPSNDLVRRKLKHIYVDKAVILGNWWNGTIQELFEEDLASLWVPFASTVFADRKLSTPLDLLDRRRTGDQLQKYAINWPGRQGTERSTIAYQQKSCFTNKQVDAEASKKGWLNFRQKFWDRVNELMAQRGTHGYAIGECNGEKKLGHRARPIYQAYDQANVDSLRHEMPDFIAKVLTNVSVYESQHKMTWQTFPAFTKYDESVLKYSHFRFVVSLENTLSRVGYITEKVMDSLLGGAIPVYAGCKHAADVIDPASYLLLKPGENDQQVAGQIVKALLDPLEYNKLMVEKALSEDQLKRFFSWHPAVWPKFGDSLRRRIVAELQRLCARGR